MTDRELAAALVAAQQLEGLARASWDARPREDLAERDAALVVVRKVTELRVVLERWIAARACRAALGPLVGMEADHGGR